MNQVRRNNESGFTLIEMMIVTALLTIVLGVLYLVSMGMAQAAQVQETKITIRDEARLSMQEITRNMRMCSRGTLVSWDTGVPVPLGAAVSRSIGFQRVEDTTGNGLGVNPDLSVGLGPMMGYGVDGADLNGDGKTVTQLVEYDVNGNPIRVLANNLSPVVNAPGTPADAPNGGIEFLQIGNGVQVTLIFSRQTGVNQLPLTFRMVEFITPRNN
ncbi:MAG: prepilin-type N-terminal cleavage/methylation domain-containing protein [Candidatus Hydrogenedentes bacterium]|nr:prepilin-type N-terminal cleavage/methylation domain-containing protein [Candidatus Hydrogenedentota bacterium]